MSDSCGLLESALGLLTFGCLDFEGAAKADLDVASLLFVCDSVGAGTFVVTCFSGTFVCVCGASATTAGGEAAGFAEAGREVTDSADGFASGLLFSEAPIESTGLVGGLTSDFGGSDRSFPDTDAEAGLAGDAISEEFDAEEAREDAEGAIEEAALDIVDEVGGLGDCLGISNLGGFSDFPEEIEVESGFVDDATFCINRADLKITLRSNSSSLVSDPDSRSARIAATTPVRNMKETSADFAVGALDGTGGLNEGIATELSVSCGAVHF